jgi:alkyl sulfatase BDS1-like metallo-beta-lactamase superfamily hydrolase
MGGADAVINNATAAIGNGELRWAAQILNYAVFADPGNTRARELLAGTYERLGHGAENGTWRNFYLQGAEELRGNVAKTDIDTAGPDMAMALTVEQVFDSMAIRVNGPKAWDKPLVIDWIITDLKQDVRLQLSHGALIQSRITEGTPAQLRLTLTKPQLLGLLATHSLDGIDAEGDTQALTTLLALLDTADKNFAIVTP